MLYVSEVDADRQRWPSLSSLDREPWAVDRGVGPFGRAVLSCVQCEPWALGRCCAVQSSAVVSTVVGPDVATKRAGLLGRRKKCGTGWTAAAEAEAGAES